MAWQTALDGIGSGTRCEGRLESLNTPRSGSPPLLSMLQITLEESIEVAARGRVGKGGECALVGQ